MENFNFFNGKKVEPTYFSNMSEFQQVTDFKLKFLVIILFKDQLHEKIFKNIFVHTFCLFLDFYNRLLFFVQVPLQEEDHSLEEASNLDEGILLVQYY